jgi:PRTRC genetic system protein E
MFKELAPLLRHRAVLFTVTHVEEDQFRVNVIPKKIADGENDALTTPVSITGTVEDLDKELPETLLHFVSSHLELKNSLDRAKAEMEEASKTARAEARKKFGNQATRKDLATISNKPAATPETPTVAKAASLFDSAPEPGNDAAASGNTPGAGAESETDEDEEILRQSYDEGDDAGESSEVSRVDHAASSRLQDKITVLGPSGGGLIPGGYQSENLKGQVPDQGEVPHVFAINTGLRL